MFPDTAAPARWPWIADALRRVADEGLDTLMDKLAAWFTVSWRGQLLK